MNTGRMMILAFSLVMALSACGKKGEQPTPAPAGTPAPTASQGEAESGTTLQLTAEQAKYAKLQSAEVAEREMMAPIEATGRVTLNEDRTIRVGSFIDGKVLKVRAKVGDRVREGQVLAEIHTHDVHEAGANLAQARAGLTQARTRASFARTSLERAERLFQSKALSKQDLDRAQVERDSMEQEVVHAEAELERAKGHLELLGLDPETLNYDASVVIRAPGGGVIMQREVTPGSSVNPGDSLFTISDLSQVWVMAEVEEKRLSELRPGAPVEVSVVAYPGESIRGSVARIGDVLNPQTRMIEVRCLVDNRAGRLKPEMYTQTKIAAGQRTMALVVSRAALQDVDGQAVVFVDQGGLRFERRKVQVGRQEADQVEIVSGLQRGEKVVVSGGFLLKSEMLKSRMDEE